MKIREEQASDIEKIWRINSDAFETDAEANLVNALRSGGCPYISLVAESENNIVGHILFTPVELTGYEDKLKLIGLAPMAVSSQYQNRGIGSELVKYGIERYRSSGYDAVVVLGHPNYYPRFGFVPSIKYDIKSEYKVPDYAFLILELVPDVLQGYSGVIKYNAMFNDF